MNARAIFATVLVAAALATVAPASAQTLDWNRVDDPMIEALGVHLGLSSGTGLSYKYPLQWWLYAQVTGGIWNSSEHKRHNLGLELQYVLRAQGRDKLFLGAGIGHYYHKSPDWTRDHVNTSFGVGLERLYGERTAVQLEVDFLYQGDEDSVILFPQAGVYFYF